MVRISIDSSYNLGQYRKESYKKPISFYDVSNKEGSKDAINCKNTGTHFKEVHSQKSTKFNLLGYQLQVHKSYHFIKKNEQRLN